MGVERLFNFTNCLFGDIEVVLGILSASHKCSQMVSKLQFNWPGQLQMVLGSLSASYSTYVARPRRQAQFSFYRMRQLQVELAGVYSYSCSWR